MCREGHKIKLGKNLGSINLVERSVYRKQARQAKRQENEAGRKRAFRIYRRFLRSKKTAWDKKLKSNLQYAKVQDLKSTGRI